MGVRWQSDTVDDRRGIYEAFCAGCEAYETMLALNAREAMMILRSRGWKLDTQYECWCPECKEEAKVV